MSGICLNYVCTFYVLLYWTVSYEAWRRRTMWEFNSLLCCNLDISASMLKNKRDKDI